MPGEGPDATGGSRVSRNRDQATDQSGRLLELAQQVSLAADFAGATEALLDRLWEMMPCDGISVMWLDGEDLKVVVSRGSTAPLRGLRLPVSQVGAARAAMDGGRPVVVADTSADGGWQPIPGDAAKPECCSSRFDADMFVSRPGFPARWPGAAIDPDRPADDGGSRRCPRKSTSWR